MAEEEDLLGAMDGLGEESAEAAPEAGGSPLKKYLPLIAGVLVVQIVIGYAIGTLFFGGSSGEEAAQAPAEPDPSTVAPIKVEEEVVWEGLDPIVVNPAGTTGLRFVSVEVHLGLVSQAAYDAIEGKKLISRIKDALIQVLSEKTIEQLDPKHHSDLKKEMRDRLNAFLSPEGRPPAVRNVYFQGFVLQ